MMRNREKIHINIPVHIISSVTDHSYYYCYLGLVHAMLCFSLSLIYPLSWMVRVDTCLLDMTPNHFYNPHISPDNVLNSTGAK